MTQARKDLFVCLFFLFWIMFLSGCFILGVQGWSVGSEPALFCVGMALWITGMCGIAAIFNAAGWLRRDAQESVLRQVHPQTLVT
jgi:hypothetical protein